MATHKLLLELGDCRLDSLSDGRQDFLRLLQACALIKLLVSRLLPIAREAHLLLKRIFGILIALVLLEHFNTSLLLLHLLVVAGFLLHQSLD